MFIGGAITGIARRLKEVNPNVKIIGIDPIQSILASILISYNKISNIFFLKQNKVP